MACCPTKARWKRPAKRPLKQGCSDARSTSNIRLIDPETGELRRTISMGSEGDQGNWIAVDGNRLLMLVGRVVPPWPEGITHHGVGSYLQPIREAKLNHGLRVTAYDLKADRILWNHEVASNLIDHRAVAAWDDKIAFLVESPDYGRKGMDEIVAGKRLVCLDAATGKKLWENTDGSLGNLMRRYRYFFIEKHDVDSMCRQDQPTEPVAAGGLLFVGGSDGKVEALLRLDMVSDGHDASSTFVADGRHRAFSPSVDHVGRTGICTARLCSVQDQPLGKKNGHMNASTRSAGGGQALSKTIVSMACRPE